ncbi:MAG: hypothetical protein AAFY71_09820 [Bacteroidota bacterium]
MSFSISGKVELASNTHIPISGVSVQAFGTKVEILKDNLVCKPSLENFRESETHKRLDQGDSYEVLKVVRGYDGKQNHFAQLQFPDGSVGWIVYQWNEESYGRLFSDPASSKTWTDSEGEFSLNTETSSPVILRFVKSPADSDTEGKGYFDAYSRIISEPKDDLQIGMEAANYMVEEKDILALLPDWKDYSYGGPAKAPKGYMVDKIWNRTSQNKIACNTFTEALLFEAWERKYGKHKDFRVSLSQHREYMINNRALDFYQNEAGEWIANGDVFGPVNLLVEKGIALSMERAIGDWEDTDYPDMVRKRSWLTCQGWSKWDPDCYYDEQDDLYRLKAKSVSGHNYMIVSISEDEEKVLSLESNLAYRINGVGIRYLGDLSKRKDDLMKDGQINPNKDAHWTQKIDWKLADIKEKHKDGDVNKTAKSLAYAQLKVCNLNWADNLIM